MLGWRTLASGTLASGAGDDGKLIPVTQAACGAVTRALVAQPLVLIVAAAAAAVANPINAFDTSDAVVAPAHAEAITHHIFSPVLQIDMQAVATATTVSLVTTGQGYDVGLSPAQAAAIVHGIGSYEETINALSPARAEAIAKPFAVSAAWGISQAAATAVAHAPANFGFSYEEVLLSASAAAVANPLASFDTTANVLQPARVSVSVNRTYFGGEETLGQAVAEAITHSTIFGPLPNLVNQAAATAIAANLVPMVVDQAVSTASVTVQTKELLAPVAENTVQASAAAVAHPIGDTGELVSLAPARAEAIVRAVWRFADENTLSGTSVTAVVGTVTADELKTTGLESAVAAAQALPIIRFDADFVEAVAHASAIANPVWVSDLAMGQASVSAIVHPIVTLFEIGDFSSNSRVWRGRGEMSHVWVGSVAPAPWIGRHTSGAVWKIKPLEAGIVSALKDEVFDIGETWPIIAYCNNANGQPIANINTALIEWMIGNPKTKARLLLVSSATPGNVVILDAATAKIGISVSPAQQTLASLQPGDYVHCLRVTEAGGTVTHQVEGRIRLRPDSFAQYV